ncbi:hypothetical protein pEaSNUABM37_00215 [Erwinia phage pEa_SNUABM_37]|nr:hypothetical protein pEaSNUABM37_00215 [Erwinia phage pEa_SNUABM_37]QXO10685.1 hypothetical protein pEaSNUABM48_00215 [Erwinia phage pEa_SNUABM_48]
MYHKGFEHAGSGAQENRVHINLIVTPHSIVVNVDTKQNRMNKKIRDVENRIYIP